MVVNETCRYDLISKGEIQEIMDYNVSLLVSLGHIVRCLSFVVSDMDTLISASSHPIH